LRLDDVDTEPQIFEPADESLLAVCVPIAAISYGVIEQRSKNLRLMPATYREIGDLADGRVSCCGCGSKRGWRYIAWRLRRVGEISGKVEASVPGLDQFDQAHGQVDCHEIGPA